ncbi:nitrate/nitrite transporter [Rhodococcus sp. NPDC059968]|uniref:MFS transporter n=1 Tax=Rhodococcus sp. NPDC059968 TaxID=3347017 RepID=UPI003672F180
MTRTSRSGQTAALVGTTLMLSLVYMSLTSWSVAVNELATTFDLTPGKIQLGSAALIAGYAIGGFVQGKWIPKLGWRRMFLYVITAFLIASALIPVIPSYPVILALRFVQGWGCMVVLMCAIVSAWYPVKKRGLAVGILLGAIGLGSALGGYLTGLLNPVLGWQGTFWVITALTVVGAIAFLALVKDAPPLDEETAVEATTSETASHRSVYTDPRLWLLGAATFCCFFNCYGMYAYLAQYLYSIGFSSGAVGTVVLLNGLIAVVSTPFGGWVSDKLVRRMGPLRARTFTNAWIALFVGAVGCALIPHLAPLSFGLALLVAVIAGWGVPATNGPGLSLPSDLLGSAAAGPAVGLVILIAGAGGIIAPVWVPMLAESYGWTVAWYVTAAAAVIGLVINLVLGARRRVTPNVVAPSNGAEINA